MSNPLHKFVVGERVWFAHGSEDKLDAVILAFNASHTTAQLGIKGWLGTHFYPVSDTRPRD